MPLENALKPGAKARNDALFEDARRSLELEKEGQQAEKNANNLSKTLESLRSGNTIQQVATQSDKDAKGTQDSGRASNPGFLMAAQTVAVNYRAIEDVRRQAQVAAISGDPLDRQIRLLQMNNDWLSKIYGDGVKIRGGEKDVTHPPVLQTKPADVLTD